MRTSLCLLAGFALVAACGEEPTEPTQLATTEIASPAAAVASNSWIIRKDMWSTERRDLTAATVTNAAGHSIVYLIGGRTTTGAPLGKVMAYDATANTWTTKASLPRPLWGMNQAAVLKGRIYVSGGCYYKGCSQFGPSEQLYVYDPATDTWTRKADMPYVRVPDPDDPDGRTLFSGMFGPTGVIGGQLYTLSDCWTTDEPWFVDCYDRSMLFYRYNPVTDRWTNLPSPKYSYGYGGVIGKKFYAVGDHVEVYDPANNQWTTKRDPTRSPSGGGGAAEMLSRIYVAGGVGWDSVGNWVGLRSLWMYDPSVGDWTRRASLPTGRYGVAAAKVFINGQPRMEVVGGLRPGNNLQYIP
jgi:N-acetylneuraminic acid mutarotase